VFAILDPDYGERLCNIWPGSAVWIVNSAVNDPIVQKLTASSPESDHVTGITVWTGRVNSVEEHLLSEIGTIDLHHGPYSSSVSYTELEVIGASLTESIRTELLRYGFAHVVEGQEGFVATRSQEEATRLRI
jgi:hypothetical protein